MAKILDRTQAPEKGNTAPMEIRAVGLASEAEPTDNLVDSRAETVGDRVEDRATTVAVEARDRNKTPLQVA